MTVQEIIQLGIGRKLTFLGRAADMISLSLSPTEECPYELSIHISTDGEIILRGVRVTCTEDMFVAVNRDFTLYDEKVRNLLDMDDIYIVENIHYDTKHCLKIQFSGGLVIQTLPESGGEGELWRIFLPWRALPHLIATQEDISLEDCNETQENLDQQRERWLERRWKRGIRQ